MNYKQILFLVAVLTCLLALGIVLAVSAVDGAAFTTFNAHVDGASKDVCKNSAVNCNIYGAKEYVWLNGGPDANHLEPDGEYFFAVLEPAGQPNPNDQGGVPDKNLSDDYDDYTNRTFTTIGGEVAAYVGTHWLDDGKSGPKPNGKPPYIRLFPYSDTTNPGGVYILAICSLENGYPVDPRDCKYDEFKVEVIPTFFYNITVGYEDLELVSSSDFDYNDWVVSFLTHLEGDYVDEDTILLEKITFKMTPMARGAELGHEFHLRFMANTFGSNGVAKLVIQDRISGTPLKSEEADFIASETKDFLINFDITKEAHKCDCEAFGDHPQSDKHNLRNTDEDNDIYNVPARRIAVLSITFNSPVLFNLPSYGQHCEGLFFDPHLHVKAAEPYEVTWMREDQKSEPRILCVQDPGWEWPEENTQIDYAYNRVVWLGEPTFFEFPPDWDDVHNTCVFDNIPCGTSPLQLYLPVITR